MQRTLSPSSSSSSAMTNWCARKDLPANRISHICQKRNSQESIWRRLGFCAKGCTFDCGGCTRICGGNICKVEPSVRAQTNELQLLQCVLGKRGDIWNVLPFLLYLLENLTFEVLHPSPLSFHYVSVNSFQFRLYCMIPFASILRDASAQWGIIKLHSKKYGYQDWYLLFCSLGSL